MLKNALEKTDQLQSNSFVTWNGTEAIIGKINAPNYSAKSFFQVLSKTLDEWVEKK